jgi:hypothetical protein
MTATPFCVTRVAAGFYDKGERMTYYMKLENTLVRVVDNKEEIVGRIYNNQLLDYVICLLNNEH